MAKNPAAVALGRKGGTATAAKLSKAARVARATKAGKASASKGGWPKGKRRGVVALLLAVGLTLPVSAWASAIDLALGGATLVVPGWTMVNNGQSCLDPPSLTASTTVTGPDILGGAVDVTLTRLQVHNPFGMIATGGTLEGMGRASLLFNWDANGDGLNLDLRDWLGLTLMQGSSDGGFGIVVRLWSAPDSWFEYQALLGSVTATGPRTYAFDQFDARGHPQLGHIDAVQIDLVKTSGVAGWIRDLSFVPQPVPVPDGGSTLVLLALGVGLLALTLTPRA